MKRISFFALLCAFMGCLSSWAQQDETARTLIVTLKNGKTIEYSTDQIEKISFDGTAQESRLITIEEVGKTSYKFSINAGGQPYIFTSLETGYLKQYSEDYMLAMFGHISYEDATYEWIDGDFFEFEEISVKPGRDYTILAAIYPGEGQSPDRIERMDLTTIAEEQTQSSVNVTLTDVTANSVKVTATPDTDVSTYIIYVRDKAWADNILEDYGEAVLQSTVERAAEYGMANHYTAASEDVWDNLLPGTDYSCIVVIEDNDGMKKMDIYNFTTLQ